MITPEKTIEQLKAELESVQAENKALLKLASHDMRSPLNKLFALVNLLKMTDDPLSKEQLGYLQNMEMVLSEGLQQMRNLVDLRALENDQVQVRWESLDVAVLLNRMVREYAPIAERKAIKILTQLATVQTFSDRQLLSRILDQLLMNAIKFSPANTEIKLVLQGGHDTFSFSVTDGGHGITPEEQSELFKKFSVLSSRTTGGESKTGLGLFLTRQNVERLRGTLRYENDNGSTFIVEIPYTDLA